MVTDIFFWLLDRFPTKEMLHLLHKESYRTRVHRGRQVEQKIFEHLEAIGYSVMISSVYEDRIEKIDGFLLNSQSKLWESVQVKFRQTGKDIALETCFLTRRNGTWLSPQDITMNGRDLQNHVKKLICLSSDQKQLRFYNYTLIKVIATYMTKKLLALRTRRGNQCTFYQDRKFGQVRVVQDTEKRYKILFFCSPQMFLLRTIHLSKEIY